MHIQITPDFEKMCFGDPSPKIFLKNNYGAFEDTSQNLEDKNKISPKVRRKVKGP